MKIGDTVMSQDGDIWEVLDVPRNEVDWPGAGSSGFYRHCRTGGQQYDSNIPASSPSSPTLARMGRSCH